MLSEVRQIKKLTHNDENFNKQGWKAELKLGFVYSANKTTLPHRSHFGPLRVQRPFYPEGDVCHVYLLHPPGGVVAGDQLSIEVNVDKQAQALITTPGAAKFYRSTGEQAFQTVSLKVSDGATLEWLPQETIIFEGANIISNVKVELASSARFIGWEILVLGRPAAGESFTQGQAILQWQIFRDGEPLFLEKMRLDSEAFLARWGLNGCSSFGTLFANGATASNLEAVRNLIADTPGRGVTLIDDLLICRASDNKTQLIRHFFEKVRSLIRSDIVQQQPYTPRIWAT